MGVFKSKQIVMFEKVMDLLSKRQKVSLEEMSALSRMSADQLMEIYNELTQEA